MSYRMMRRILPERANFKLKVGPMKIGRSKQILPRPALIMAMLIALLGVACAQPESQAGEQPSAGAVAVEQSAETMSGAPAIAAATPVSSPQAMAATTPAISAGEMAMRLDLPDVVEQVMPSVVGITTERTLRGAGSLGASPFGDDPFFRQFFGQRPMPQPRERVQQGLGSGVIVDASGVIVTNNHVIEGADTIRVALSDGREFSAEIKGEDPASDIAVIQLTDPPDDLHAIALGDSDALRLGESVIAIGNPFGLTGTVTLGIISAKGRANMGIVDYEDFIQTDAAINPGNSGGALINLQGQLVGINTAILSRSGGYQGVGLAIPSNMVQMVMTSLLEDGEVQRGWLGVMIQELTPQLAEALGVAKNTQGVVVSDVQPGSPAAAAGLERGDVITSVDRQPVGSPAALRNIVGLKSPSTSVELAYVRAGEAATIELTLGSLHQGRELATAGTAGRGESSASPVEGLELASLNPELRRQFQIPEAIRTGVVVQNVTPGSPAARLQFRRGDVILEVNRRGVNSVADFAAAFDESRQQNLFLLYRDGATIFMTR